MLHLPISGEYPRDYHPSSRMAIWSALKLYLVHVPYSYIGHIQLQLQNDYINFLHFQSTYHFVMFP